MEKIHKKHHHDVKKKKKKHDVKNRFSTLNCPLGWHWFIPGEELFAVCSELEELSMETDYWGYIQFLIVI